MSSTSASTSATSDEICAVCMDSLASKRSVSLHPCNHRFHRSCIVQWFEAGKFSLPKDFTCCLCRAESDRTYDENEQIVPRFYPFELTEFIPSFIAPSPYYEEYLVTIGSNLIKTIEDLDREKKLSIANKKNEEFIEDIGEEIKKLMQRLEAVEEIFITLALEEHIEMEFLEEEKDQLEEELANTISLEILRRKEEELEGITRRIDYLEEKAVDKFREMCEMALTSTASVDAA